jgi:hypothetical protein
VAGDTDPEAHIKKGGVHSFSCAKKKGKLFPHIL